MEVMFPKKELDLELVTFYSPELHLLALLISAKAELR